MASGMESHECEIAIALDFANLFPIPAKLQILKPNFVVGLLTRPFEGFRPTMVT